MFFDFTVTVEVEDAFERALQRQEHARYVDFLELLGEDQSPRVFSIRAPLSELSLQAAPQSPLDSTLGRKYKHLP